MLKKCIIENLDWEMSVTKETIKDTIIVKEIAAHRNSAIIEENWNLVSAVSLMETKEKLLLKPRKFHFINSPSEDL